MSGGSHEAYIDDELARHPSAPESVSSEFADQILDQSFSAASPGTLEPQDQDADEGLDDLSLTADASLQQVAGATTPHQLTGDASRHEVSGAPTPVPSSAESLPPLPTETDFSASLVPVSSQLFATTLAAVIATRSFKTDMDPTRVSYPFQSTSALLESTTEVPMEQDDGADSQPQQEDSSSSHPAPATGTLDALPVFMRSPQTIMVEADANQIQGIPFSSNQTASSQQAVPMDQSEGTSHRPPSSTEPVEGTSSAPQATAAGTSTAGAEGGSSADEGASVRGDASSSGGEDHGARSSKSKRGRRRNRKRHNRPSSELISVGSGEAETAEAQDPSESEAQASAGTSRGKQNPKRPGSAKGSESKRRRQDSSRAGNIHEPQFDGNPPTYPQNFQGNGFRRLFQRVAGSLRSSVAGRVGTY